jgi:PKD repeat protein
MRIGFTALVVLAAFAGHVHGQCGSVPPLTTSNVVLSFTDAAALCTPTSCPSGENIDFVLQAFGTDFSCSPHTFDWNFGDGTLITTTVPTAPHVYTAVGVYNVTVHIKNPESELTLSRSLTVSSSIPTLSGCVTLALGLLLGIVGLWLIR